MQRQNITLSLPKDLLKQVKHLAIERDTSVSGLLSEYLERIVRDDRDYRQAETRIKRRLKSGFDLGTNGRLAWKREDLHER